MNALRVSHPILDPAMILVVGSLAIQGQAAHAVEIGASACKDWELAARAFYRGPGDKTFEFYEEANRWIIGHVLGSPIWPGSKVHGIVDGLFRGTTRDPNAVLSGVTERIIEESLDYCRKNPANSISGAAEMLLRTK